MIAKTLKFVDYNGNPCVETFHFNISEAELIEMQITGRDGDMAAFMRQIIEAEDNAEILKAFKDIIGLAIGYKTEDGKYFRKSEETTRNFFDSPAFSALFLDIATNKTSGVDFIEAILPDNLEEIAKAQEEANQANAKTLNVVPEAPAAGADLTQAAIDEIRNNPEKFAHMFNTNIAK